MSRIKNCFILFIIVLTICPSCATARKAADQGTTQKATDQETVKKTVLAGKNHVLADENRNNSQPVLAITPREVDVGTISPGEVVTGVFTFKNMGSGVLYWSTTGPEGWRKLENQKLSNIQEDDTDSLHFEIRLPVDGEQLKSYKYKTALYNTEIQLEVGRGKLICQKDLHLGIHKEAIKITSTGGSRTIYVTFKIVATQESPMINFNPARLDMGCVIPGKTVSKKIMLTNKGKERLVWAVVARKPKRNENTSIFKKERYISFLNEEVRESGDYSVPGHLRDSVELYGKWTENDGYPFSVGGGNSIKYRFNGTGISLNMANQSEEGSLAIYLDENMLNSHNWSASKKEKGELVLAEGLADSPHVLTVVNKEGNLKIEGVKISGKDIIRGPSGWMTVLPNSGTTTSQTNYLNVILNTGQLAPGYYGDNIVFKTNGGDEIVEVYVEVIPDNVSRVIDIYRYSKGLDYLFTANPQMETKRFSQNAYVKEGIAFRLFVPETPGTRSFYRWYNPQKKDHFYHHDSRGGGKNLQGYVFEGTIGNIATSKMTNTRELYRWVNTSTGNHFYSTDPKGEKVVKKRYRFEGIAGYVK
jgi:hypothetical protein